LTDDNPLPSVVETYRRITGQDAIAIGKRIPSGEIVVPCVAKQNHTHGDSSASMRINLDKDAWRCDPCAAQGIEGGKSTHLVVASGIALNLGDASRWLAPRQEPEKEIAAPPPDQQRLAAEYDYRDAEGKLLYQVRRFEFEVDGKKGKTFSQRRALPGGGWEGRLGDVERVPYRYPEMITAMGEGKTIYVVEGEKDVERLASVGLVATTNAGGAGWKWTKAFTDFFRAATNVVVIGDNDEAGRAAARARAEALSLICGSVRVVEAIPGTGPKGDVSDWFDANPKATEKSFRSACATVAKLVGPEIDDGHMAALPIGLIHRRILAQQNVIIPAVPFSIPVLDQRLGGMQEGRVSVMASRANQGKTAFAMRVVSHASRSNVPVLVLSLEMGQTQWHDRMGANSEMMSVREYRDKGRPDSADISWWDSHRLWVASGGKDSTLDKIEELIALHEPKLVVVDHLRHIKGWLPMGNKRADIAASEIMYAFPEIAKKRKCHFMLLHQLNRAGTDEPKLEHLRDAGAVEEVADNVILLHRPFKTLANGTARTQENADDIMHLHLAKSREAGELVVHLGWDGPTMDVFPPRDDEQRARYGRCCA
jgi:KaiC/GvpD/RAD55 family RecA-like ATPase